jgi:ParB family chromosome partitioning protein
VTLIPVDKILPNPDQPRQVFDQEKLQELADSIRDDGVRQAITVEDHGDHYILEDGERRLRAAKLAGLPEIPATLVPPLSGKQTAARLKRALVANLHREDMNPIEEARAFQKLKDTHAWSNAAVARQLRLSPVRVPSRLIWLELDEQTQQLVAEGKLQKHPDVAKALLSIPDEEARRKVLKRIAHEGMSISLIKTICTRLKAEIEGQAQREQDKAAGIPPAIAFGRQRAERPLEIPLYTQLAGRGKLPEWELLQEAAERACKACSWYETASPTICGECPAVQLVAELAKSTTD